MPEPEETLLDEAMRKTGIVWVAPEIDGRAYPAWHLWQDGCAYLVAGGAEQPLPGLARTRSASVTVPSKQTGGRLLAWTASVHRVEPDSEEWQRVLPGLHGKRLNATDGAGQAERWARESTVFRLRPTGELTEHPDRPRTESHAAAPVATPASTAPPLPFVLGRAGSRR